MIIDVKSDNVGKRFEITYYKDYDVVSNTGTYPYHIKATMVNNDPQRFVFENEYGMYIIPYNAIIIMKPIEEENREMIDFSKCVNRNNDNTCKLGLKHPCFCCKEFKTKEK